MSTHTFSTNELKSAFVPVKDFEHTTKQKHTTHNKRIADNNTMKPHPLESYKNQHLPHCKQLLRTNPNSSVNPQSQMTSSHLTRFTTPPPVPAASQSCVANNRTASYLCRTTPAFGVTELRQYALLLVHRHTLESCSRIVSKLLWRPRVSFSLSYCFFKLALAFIFSSVIYVRGFRF